MLLSISGRPPEDQGIRVIQAAVDQGISLIDTADCYCYDHTDFHHNEKLVIKALKGRRDQITIMTKVGCRRPGGAWTIDARPEYLTEAAHNCLKSLGVDTIDLLALNSPDSRVPFAESVGALARLREQGKIRHVGLCNAQVSHIEEARAIVPITSVQNRWHPQAREVEKNGVLDYCRRNQITFFAYSPFGGTLGAPTLGTLKLAEQARRRRVSPYRLVLAWMLAKSPICIPLPGARRVESILDSVSAADMELDSEAVKAVEATLPPR
jgi:aryl-alcohol dehydrogenase-like predicted oxidoreductase